MGATSTQSARMFPWLANFMDMGRETMEAATLLPPFGYSLVECKYEKQIPQPFGADVKKELVTEDFLRCDHNGIHYALDVLRMPGVGSRVVCFHHTSWPSYGFISGSMLEKVVGGIVTKIASPALIISRDPKMVAGDGIYVCPIEAAYFAKIDDIVANNYGDAEHVMKKYKSNRHDDVRVAIPVEAPVQYVKKFNTDPPSVNDKERQVFPPIPSDIPSPSCPPFIQGKRWLYCLLHPLIFLRRTFSVTLSAHIFSERFTSEHCGAERCLSGLGCIWSAVLVLTCSVCVFMGCSSIGLFVCWFVGLLVCLRSCVCSGCVVGLTISSATHLVNHPSGSRSWSRRWLHIRPNASEWP